MKHDHDNDFLNFLTSREAPPAELSALVQKDISFQIQKTSILFRFVCLQLFGALLTLSFCPQFGIGLPEGHGITHIFRLYGDWACATFCGTLFLVAGNLLASLVMDKDQYFWIWKRYKLPLIILPTFFWAGLMLFNLTWKLQSETLVYHFFWIASAILAQEGMMFLRTNNYRGVFYQGK